MHQYEPTALEQAAIQLKYERYLQKEKEWAEKTQKLENLHFPTDFNYNRIKALSAEASEKLKQIRPTTLRQAAQISGVSPADIAILMVYLGR